ncbi:MAG: 50S ribosomal protein L6 [Cyanobacteria bacterium J06639_1]
MSRIGKKPIPVPKGVEVKVDGQNVSVKGSKGELKREIPAQIAVELEDGEVAVSPAEDSRKARQMHGLCRTLVANMVDGVSKGFEKRLEIQGVGYRAAMKGTTLVLNVGYSNPVEIPPPAGITMAVEANTNVIVSGISKELVGNTAARIRDVRPPEPYKGKGIRYAGEMVRRKAGKSGKK